MADKLVVIMFMLCVERLCSDFVNIESNLIFTMLTSNIEANNAKHNLLRIFIFIFSPYF